MSSSLLHPAEGVIAASLPRVAPLFRLVRVHGTIALGWLASAIAGAAPAGSAAEPANMLRPFEVWASRTCFSNINQNDAAAALSVFIDGNGKDLANAYRTVMHFFDQPEPFQQAVRNGQMHMTFLDGWQFLTFDLPATLKPYFVAAENGRIGRRYLLLTRKEAGIRTVEDLRDKTLLLPGSAQAIGGRWLDTVLGERSLGVAEDFFRRVTIVPKGSAAVLPVFFGKADACLVEESNLDVLKELNPQVGGALQVLTESDFYAFAVVCISEEWDPGAEENRLRALKVLRELHLHKAGQQMLTLVKISQLVPFEEGHFDPLRRLHAAYERVRRSRRSAATPPATPTS